MRLALRALNADAAESDMRERAAGVLDARAKEIRMGEASFVALARFTECSESAAAIRALPLNGGGK
jgi:hypothetical protein